MTTRSSYWGNPERYRAQYDHVLADEFQDVGERMIEMLHSLTGIDGARLFVVGDDWQSIYSFRGSEMTYFVEFEEYVGHVARTTMTANFRSPETVIEAGNALLSRTQPPMFLVLHSRFGQLITPHGAAIHE